MKPGSRLKSESGLQSLSLEAGYPESLSVQESGSHTMASELTGSL